MPLVLLLLPSIFLLSACSLQEQGLKAPERTSMKTKKQLYFASSKEAQSKQPMAPVVSAPYVLAEQQGFAEVRDIHQVQEQKTAQPHLLIEEVPRPVTNTLAEPAEKKEEQLIQEIKPGSSTWQWPSSHPLTKAFSLQTDAKRGIEIRGRAGDPVYASANGKVVYKGNGIRGYGELVILKHEKGFLSAYAHNQTILVEEGEEVRMGQTIAKMGPISADTYGLHFEIRYNGTPVDPLKYLPKR